jgi:hypothetical protein
MSHARSCEVLVRQHPQFQELELEDLIHRFLTRRDQVGNWLMPVEQG